MAGCQQLIDILLVDVASFTLPIGTIVAAKAYALVEMDAQPGEGFDDIGFCTRNKTLRVSIFDAENQVTAMLFGKKVIIQSSADTTDVQSSRGAGGKANSNFSFSHNSLNR